MDVREKLVEIERAAEWFEKRAENKPMPMARKMFELAGETLREKANGVTVQELDGCEYCNGLPFSQMEDFTMPNASKKDYDIVTIRFCPMCGRRLPQPPKGE